MMNREACALAARDMFEHFGSKYAEKSDTGNTLDHMRWMAEAIDHEKHMADDKANRWLGYIQGFMVVSGYVTLEQCKIINSRHSSDPQLSDGRHEMKEATAAVDHFAVVEQVLAENPMKAHSTIDGGVDYVHWFVGQYMKLTHGKGNPKTADFLFRAKLVEMKDKKDYETLKALAKTYLDDLKNRGIITDGSFEAPPESQIITLKMRRPVVSPKLLFNYENATVTEVSDGVK